MFLQELKKFSKQNWWVYLMLLIILAIVYYTGKGNLLEIIMLFLINFLANIFIMVAMGNYSEKNNKIGSFYHVGGTTLFVILGLYGLFFQDFYQYILFQIGFIIAAIKAFSFYNYKKDIKIFNEKTMFLLNTVLLIIFIKYFYSGLFGLLQVIGFSLVTIGLVSIKDSFRYFGNLFGTFFIIGGSILGIYLSYNNGNIDGISLGYALLTTTALIYFLKLLPKYFPKK